jgi:hypothetical protein
MGKKKVLNERRLTKKQVQELIESEGEFHEEFTAIFSGLLSDNPQIYELSKERFLYVHDPNGTIIPGRGDIYPKEYLLRMMQWMQKVTEDSANGRGSSVEHWYYYSINKSQLANKIFELTNELARCLEISQDLLDYSYKSLDILSGKAEDFGLEKVQVELYDHLVAYVGEVMRRRVEGQWVVNENYPGCEHPMISVNQGVLMPINVVWQELAGLEVMNLRKEVINEVRRFSVRYR